MGNLRGKKAAAQAKFKRAALEEETGEAEVPAECSWETCRKRYLGKAWVELRLIRIERGQLQGK